MMTGGLSLASPFYTNIRRVKNMYAEYSKTPTTQKQGLHKKQCQNPFKHVVPLFSGILSRETNKMITVQFNFRSH